MIVLIIEVRKSFVGAACVAEQPSDPAEISGRSDDNDAANWVAGALRWSAGMGLSPAGPGDSLLLRKSLRLRF